MRQGIHLRGYAQKDPKQEYKRECFHLFSRMLSLMEYEITARLLSLHWQAPDAMAMNESFDLPTPLPSENVLSMKLGRNEPCHCGSGEKFKNCHGRLV